MRLAQVPAVGKPAQRVLLADRIEGFPYGSHQCFAAPGPRSPKEGLYLREGFLDGRENWRVGWQEQHARAPRSDQPRTLSPCGLIGYPEPRCAPSLTSARAPARRMPRRPPSWLTPPRLRTALSPRATVVPRALCSARGSWALWRRSARPWGSDVQRYEAYYIRAHSSTNTSRLGSRRFT
jgi:hypothetical protein